MSLHESPAALRRRLMNPPNAVVDHGIDLRRHLRPAPIQVSVEEIPCSVDKADNSKIVRNPPTQISDCSDVERARIEHLLQTMNPTLSHLVPGRASSREILRIVGRYYGIRLDDLLSQRRTAALAVPRHVAAYLAKRLTGASLPAIGRAFGGRDHTTILNSLQRIEVLRVRNPSIDVDIKTLLSVLRPTGEESDADDQPAISA